jgi:hypothetical protein
LAPGVVTKVIAATCALVAFVVAILAGLFANNPAETILLRALISLVAANLVGMIVGAIGERTIAEALAKYREDHPIPTLKPSTPDASAPVSSPVVLSA